MRPSFRSREGDNRRDQWLRARRRSPISRQDALRPPSNGFRMSPYPYAQQSDRWPSRPSRHQLVAKPPQGRIEKFAEMRKHRKALKRSSAYNPPSTRANGYHRQSAEQQYIRRKNGQLDFLVSELECRPSCGRQDRSGDVHQSHQLLRRATPTDGRAGKKQKS